MKQEVVTVGLDLAKNVFQVHAIGGDGTVLLRRKLGRAEVVGFITDLPACLVGMEARQADPGDVLIALAACRRPIRVYNLVTRAAILMRRRRECR